MKVGEFEVVIGIETHVQLATRTKLFCGCDNDSREAAPNTHVCPVCMGMPGTLPVLNARAVELALRLGTALNANFSLPMHTKFDRKNYFYPDLPKGYQITQFDEPIVPNGYVEFDVNGLRKRVGITRAHLEGDAGKLTHPDDADYSLVDFNRAETPLVEIVSEPDMRSAAEAKGYAQELYNIVRYAGVSDANLYYGNMRFDVNVSVRLEGQTEFGTRTETKNLNSFKAIERTILYESSRQVEVIKAGGRIRQETRGWNDTKGETYPMRSKEDADEYRYFPEPDLPPVVINADAVGNAGHDLVRPADLRKRLTAAGLSLETACTLVDQQAAVLAIEAGDVAEQTQLVRIANWLVGEVRSFLVERNLDLAATKLTAQVLRDLSDMVEGAELSATAAKQVLRHILTSGGNPPEVAKLLGLTQNSDLTELTRLVDEVLAGNQAMVADYRSGNQRVFGALVGAAMKSSGGQGNPQVINQLLRDKLDQ